MKQTILCLLLWLSVSTTFAQTKPNIIFILIDDLRWDGLSATGHPYAKTPHIDRLAHEGELVLPPTLAHIFCGGEPKL